MKNEKVVALCLAGAMALSVVAVAVGETKAETPKQQEVFREQKTKIW